jgi:hypothetical protein
LYFWKQTTTKTDGLMNFQEFLFSFLPFGKQQKRNSQQSKNDDDSGNEMEIFFVLSAFATHAYYG